MHAYPLRVRIDTAFIFVVLLQHNSNFMSNFFQTPVIKLPIDTLY
ncbi:hypothetical protein QWZ13_14710 [Reinekea marina]|nr:hypothetical protein [Reinekea marina]MDN3650167.1 hypothetical protein [Reinekea marina]